MSSITTPIVLALSLGLAQGVEPRITFVEGTVSLSAEGVRTAGGRAELVLPNGTLVHVDGASGIQFDRTGALTLGSGRLLLRTANGLPSDLDVPYARLRLAPLGIYSVLADAAHERLLVSVIAGRVDLRGRYGQATSVGPGQMVMMTSATSTPWATAFQPAGWDRFELWSDARLAQAAWQSGSTAYEATAESGVALNTYPASPTCSSWMSIDNPCWIVPSYPSPYPSTRRPRPHVRPAAPGYAPNVHPDYAPNFNVPPPGTFPGAPHGPSAGQSWGHGPGSSPRPPSAAPHRPERGRAVKPVPAPPPPGPAPQSGAATRGTGGGIRVPERPSPE